MSELRRHHAPQSLPYKLPLVTALEEEVNKNRELQRQLKVALRRAESAEYRLANIQPRQHAPPSASTNDNTGLLHAWNILEYHFHSFGHCITALNGHTTCFPPHVSTQPAPQPHPHRFQSHLTGPGHPGHPYKRAEAGYPNIMQRETFSGEGEKG
jgi:hypothetical protein